MKVTKEDVDKAEAEWVTAYDDAKAINAAHDAVYEAAAAYAAADEAWDEYVKLRREYDSGN
jgi:CO dehydrogenase/acetyl-CoA synthase gamma subunit (corrinoid Fe-S protein)